MLAACARPNIGIGFEAVGLSGEVMRRDQVPARTVLGFASVRLATLASPRRTPTRCLLSSWKESCVTHVYAQSVTYVCARCPPRPSPPQEERERFRTTF